MKRTSEIMDFDRIAGRVAGYSYAVEPLNVEVSGWQPVNIDVRRALERAYFMFLDDEGTEHDDGRFQIMSIKRVTPMLVWREEQEMKQRGAAPNTQIRMAIPKGSRREALAALKATLATFDIVIITRIAQDLNGIVNRIAAETFKDSDKVTLNFVHIRTKQPTEFSFEKNPLTGGWLFLQNGGNPHMMDKTEVARLIRDVEKKSKAEGLPFKMTVTPSRRQD